MTSTREMHPFTPEERATVDGFIRLLNGQESRAQKLLFERLLGEHPTLEQGFWRVIKNVAASNADIEDKFFDARNIGSHEWCKAVTNGGRNPSTIGMPYI